MWFKVEIKLNDESTLERVLEANSITELQQFIFNEFNNQVVYIKGSPTDAPSQDD